VYTQGGKRSSWKPRAVERGRRSQRPGGACQRRGAHLALHSRGSPGRRPTTWPSRPLSRRWPARAAAEHRPQAGGGLGFQGGPARDEEDQGRSRGCDNPKDLIRNRFETYAARQRAAAAAMAGSNIRSRNDVEKKRLEELPCPTSRARQKKVDAAAIKQDYFDDAAIAKAARDKAAARLKRGAPRPRRSSRKLRRPRSRSWPLRKPGAGSGRRFVAKADVDLAASFGVAIAASVETLRKDYTRGPRARV